MATGDILAQSTNSSTILGGELTTTPFPMQQPACATPGPPVPGAYPEDWAHLSKNGADMGGEGLVDAAKAAVAGITGYFAGSSPSAHQSTQSSPPLATEGDAVDSRTPERQSTVSSFTSSGSLVSDISSVEDRQHDGYAPLGSTPTLLLASAELAGTPTSANLAPVHLNVGGSDTHTATPPFTPISPVNGLDADVEYFPSTAPLQISSGDIPPFTPIPPVKSEADGASDNGYFASRTPPAMKAGDPNAVTAIPLARTHHFFSDPEHPLSLSLASSLSDPGAAPSSANASFEAIATSSVAASSNSSLSVFTASAHQLEMNTAESLAPPEVAWEKFEERGFGDGVGIGSKFRAQEETGFASSGVQGIPSGTETEEAAQGHEREETGDSVDGKSPKGKRRSRFIAKIKEKMHV